MPHVRHHRFLRSRHKIEIDITWLCNLTCFDCNRGCGNAPTKQKMRVAQVENFIQESVDANYQWKIIRLVGGEPTLHPDFEKIVGLLVEYRSRFSEDVAPIIVVCTNGFSSRTKDILSRLPPEVVIDNSEKVRGDVAHIGHFNVAPRDGQSHRENDYTLACTNATYCGMGLTPYGYYHCPVAGTIDRIFGFDLGKKSLPEIEDEMDDLKEECCSKCGFFEMNDSEITPALDNLAVLREEAPISESWAKAYEELKQVGQHELSPY